MMTYTQTIKYLEECWQQHKAKNMKDLGYGNTNK